MSYESEVLDDSPVLFWKLDEDSGTTATDSSGVGNDGTYSGEYDLEEPAIFDDGGTAVGLNHSGGSADGAVLVAAPTNWPTTAVSLELWYRDTTSPAASAGMLTYAEGTAYQELALFFTVSGGHTFTLYIKDTAAAFNTSGPSPAAAAQSPKHVVVTWSSATGDAKLYVNGIHVETVSGVETGESIAAGGTFVLGQDQDSVGGGFQAAQAFKAIVDNVAVYATVLSAERVRAHWEAGAATAFPQYYHLVAASADVDDNPPVVDDFTSPTTIEPSDPVSFTVTEDSKPTLDTEVWVTYGDLGRTELVYASGTFFAPYTGSGVSTSVNTDTFTVEHAQGWPGDFTITVIARDSANETTESEEYTVDGDLNYPPHMDPLY